ncbi:MAG: serine/threonine-protein kinase [Proteobacteria bacterium]|nr:serine/threonine-protein kinase [Pseudomonadota bacterium]MBU1738454.1 serine/threonine-protein kinase [Pseudomonadota bacterium]
MDESTTFSRAVLRELMARHTDPKRIPDRFKVITDTSDFIRVEYNDVVLLGDTPFLVKGYEKEGRFGLDDEPKYWVRRAIDLTDGATRILKLVFHEEFETKIGEVVIKCFRSPKKEGRILDLVRNHDNFMHGRWVLDAAGNNVRILDYIYGRRYDELITGYGEDHHDYFHHYFPQVLNEYIQLVEAIKFLHDHGEKHGDIRRDHIIRDRELNINRWIDFDYNFMHGESLFSFDLQGLGNILIFLTGRGDVLVADLYHDQKELFDTLWGEDLNISYKNRVANLRKIYPYVPESLNRILLHFSRGANIFYETTDQMLDDLARARADLVSLTGRTS